MPKKSPVWHLGWDWGREGSTHKGSGGAQQGHIHTAGLGHAPAKSRGLHLSTWVSKSFLPEDIWQGCNRDGHLHLARKGPGGKAGKQTACCGGQHLNKRLAHHWSLTPAGLTLQHPLQGARMPHLQGQMVTGRSHARAKLHTSKIAHEQNCAQAKLRTSRTVLNQNSAQPKACRTKFTPKQKLSARCNPFPSRSSTYRAPALPAKLYGVRSSTTRANLALWACTQLRGAEHRGNGDVLKEL